MVQALAKEEIEAYEKFETHIGIMTSVLVLLLTVIPPTELLGIAIGAYQGYKDVKEGRTLAQARGANDVISPEQQDAADMKVVMGAISIVLSAFSLSRAGMEVYNVKRMVPTNIGTELPPVISAEVNADGQHLLVSELNTSTPRVTVIQKDGSEVNYTFNELKEATEKARKFRKRR